MIILVKGENITIDNGTLEWKCKQED